MQTAKFSSQSDPLSSIAVVGKEVTRAKDKADIEKMRQEHNETTGGLPVEEPGPVAPDQNITSQHIETNHQVLEKKKLSDYRPSKPIQQRRFSQTGESPFQTIQRPGVKRPPPSQRVAPNGYPEHMHQAHKDSMYMGHIDT
jgi:hypothetical protein